MLTSETEQQSYGKKKYPAAERLHGNFTDIQIRKRQNGTKRVFLFLSLSFERYIYIYPWLGDVKYRKF